MRSSRHVIWPLVLPTALTILAACDSGDSRARPVVAPLSSATLSGRPSTAGGYAPHYPATCSFLDRRPDLLNALYLYLPEASPWLETVAPGQIVTCTWHHGRNVLTMTNSAYVASTRKDNIARARRAFRGGPCPVRVADRAGTQRVTWEEGCLTFYEEDPVKVEDNGVLLSVRRGNVQVSMTISTVRRIDHKEFQRISGEIAHAALESFPWIR